MTVRLGSSARVNDITSGWGWLGLLRLGLALAMLGYTLTYHPLPGNKSPSAVRPLALGLAGLVLALGIAQLLRRVRASRAFAVLAYFVDAGAVLATLGLFSFDPRRYFLALVIVVQAEGGVILGLLGGFLAWVATSAGYVAVEILSASTDGATPSEVVIRIAVGLLLALGGGYLATELSGERARRLAEREEEVRRLEEAERKYRLLVEQIPVITYVDAVDRESSTIYISPQVQEVLGYSQEEWTEDPGLWAKLLHEDDRDRVLGENARTNATGEPFRAEYRLMTKDAEVVWLRDEAVLITDDSGRPRFWQGVMVDITDRKRAEEQVAFLAYHDKLTGLPNRAMFEELLELALARARRSDLAVAVLFMDLDNFKLVNDSLGHAAGDDLLREMASRLSWAVRAADVVARQGGDEFLVLVADMGREVEDGHGGATESALALAGRIHEALKLPFTLFGTEFFITASIGVSLFPESARDARTLMMQADAAMYRSKQHAPGESMVFAMEAADPFTRLSLATRLRKAADRREWVLYYQPIVNLEEGTIVGAEALVRWQQSPGRLLGPTEFIPLAEEMGLIASIGDWVIEEMCRQWGAWAELGLDLSLSFNLSPRQLWQQDTVPKLLRRIAAARADPTRLIVEITESTAMRDPERTQRILDEMHEAGLRLAIDDFGTGYSSLDRLRSLPVDVLKIDRRFVHDVPENPDAAMMVQAIIALARSLSMQPLAEGIERPEQRTYLVNLGCPLGQGFLFSQPVPPEEFVRVAARKGFASLSSQ